MHALETRGPLLALLSAVLFGVSPPLAKLLMGNVSPFALAGLLYLGSGIGLGLLAILRRDKIWIQFNKLPALPFAKLAGAIISGGVLAPLCLAYAIRSGSASEISLLLNLETVMTMLIAWLIFREYIGIWVWTGMLFMITGAALIALTPSQHLTVSRSALFVIAACAFWGLDNNLTRGIDQLSANAIATVKGLFAGSFSLGLGLVLAPHAFAALPIFGLLALGAFSYGMSLILFIEALQRIGASRASTYFASGPFIGVIISIVILGESPPAYYWIAAVAMLVGLAVLLRERHIHEHAHQELLHRHRHLHDSHHAHEHEGSQPPEPHDHWHRHKPVTHSHFHWPDLHHRHKH